METCLSQRGASIWEGAKEWAAEMAQKERDLIMNEFRSGATRVLITTDVWARGIDVQQVSLVMNYALPTNRENYIHRIGRAGRYGRKGVAINLLTPRDAPQLRDIEHFYATQVDEMPSNNLHRNIIVTGDINLNLIEPSVHPHHYNSFKSFLRKLNLIDVATKANYHSIPTWRGFGERAASKSQIDVFLCSKENPDFNFVNYKVHASSSSDHMILNIGLGQNRTRASPPSDPRTVPWKDHIITSRAFKNEAQEALISLLSEKSLDPSRIDLALFNDEKTSLHKKLAQLDQPDNIEMLENDLTYLLPLILKIWKKIHDSIFLEYSQKSVKYKHDTFQKSFTSICKK